MSIQRNTSISATDFGQTTRRGPLAEGDRVQVRDPKGRFHQVILVSGGRFQSNRGGFDHNDVIGRPDGQVMITEEGRQFQILRPLQVDYVMSMPRGAAVVYPKDAAQIIVKADIFPGARVVEAGVGSGALSIALLRAVGDYGCVHSFERREEFADVARGNIETMFGGPHPAWKLSIGDLQDTLPQVEEPGSVDRVVLDMLAPWECLDAVAEALAPGGVLICYVATVTQMSRLVEGMRLDGRFTEPECDETIVRGWHVEGLAVRPDHRMVAHTAFLVVARRLADGAVRLAPKRRASKTDFSEEDMNAWIPMNVGEREVTDKKIRRAARDAKNLAAHAARANEIALEQNGMDSAQNGIESEQNDSAAAETGAETAESAE